MQLFLKDLQKRIAINLPVRHARPGRGDHHVRPDRGDAKRPDRADRRSEGDLLRSRHALRGAVLRRQQSSSRAHAQQASPRSLIGRFPVFEGRRTGPVLARRSARKGRLVGHEADADPDPLRDRRRHLRRGHDPPAAAARTGAPAQLLVAKVTSDRWPRADSRRAPRITASVAPADVAIVPAEPARCEPGPPPRLAFAAGDRGPRCLIAGADRGVPGHVALARRRPADRPRRHARQLCRLLRQSRLCQDVPADAAPLRRSHAHRRAGRLSDRLFHLAPARRERDTSCCCCSSCRCS